MKRGVIFVSLLFLILFTSVFVSAVPKNFAIENVYWAVNGTIRETVDNTDRPFLLGLVELSFDTEKGRTSNPIAYLKYQNAEYYSSSFGLIKDTSQATFTEAQFYPLATFASDEIKPDYVPIYTLIIPLSQTGEINFENIRLSRLNSGLSIPTFQKNVKASTEIDYSVKLPSNITSASCSKSSVYNSSSVEMCGTATASNEEEVDKCRKENGNLLIGVECKIFCLSKFYSSSIVKKESKTFEDCFVYGNITFDKFTSSSLNFGESPLNSLANSPINPWRTGP